LKGFHTETFFRLPAKVLKLLHGCPVVDDGDLFAEGRCLFPHPLLFCKS
jgi:hypothetical protein